MSEHGSASRFVRGARLGVVAAIVAGALASGGCQTKQNDRVSIGPVLDDEAMTPGAYTIVPRVASTLEPPPLVQDEPTLFSLDRTEWEVDEFMVPVDGVAHRPRGVSPYRYGKTWRASGAYPTLDSVLEAGNTDGQAVEGLYAPLRAIGDFFLLPVRAFVTPQWDVAWSPADAYERWHNLPKRTAREVVDDAEARLN
ncbi:MAG: hypothetical protein RBS39_08720 [Phycisphaerales bacterium]|jgi:hypothetical protein|nr:hypothetical protein [Phycisphaerales bacterium]